ncbi:MAG: preprotein translocase subunit YajC [Bacillota bacterium]
MQNWGGTVIYLGLFFVILYFLMIRPQQNQQKKRQEMLGQMQLNDRIITVGGLHGKITKMKDESVMLRIADKVEVEMQKSAISQVLGKGDDNNNQ